MANVADSGSPLTDSRAPPDWSQIDAEIRCPQCDYDLRGLREPRCPECAYRFSWAEMLDPERRVHPYLFEHHPERNRWSFWRTATNSFFRPRRFWTSIRDIHSYRPWRMVLYWSLSSGAYLLGLVFLFAAGVVVAKVAQPGWSIPAIVADMLSTSDYWSLVLAPLPWLWPWLTFLALSAICIPMGTARAEWMANLRCALYSFDLCLWIGLHTIVISILAPVTLQPGDYEDHVLWVVAALPFAWLVGCYHFLVACKQYRRFHRPVLTGLVSQTAVFVAVWGTFHACDLSGTSLGDLFEELADRVFEVARLFSRS